ncbi:stage III sporulation protein SpoIIIAB [Terribacillus saccharophilus]|uniref:stage III sporulation protein SpoIIIAB n=1 Tax=Terribacillus saccharophilus TaxID=361277 RepID=UPI000C9B2EB5|nr:stage III sporulation protein SpoIIIAB [Terribacillus goriensis]
MKWVGAILVLIAATWVGFDLSRRLQQRPKQIRQLISSLQVMEAEILYSQTSIIETSDNLAKQVPQPAAAFFQTLSDKLLLHPVDLYDCWEETTEAWIDTTALKTSEKDVWLQFGRTLGQHDFEQQQKHIQLAKTHLERELEESEEANQRYGKMIRNLGFLTGLLIVLLLI